MSERRGTKALETWCRRLCEGYPGVKVENMTTSWRDGLAFCALIHHFRPDLIDFASLNPTNIFYNNSLAFSVAERQLGIPALLDADDMVMYSVPDRLSILTYLSQFYQVFGNQGGVSAGGKQGSSTRIVPKRSAISADRGIISSASSSPPSKMTSRPSIGVTGRREPCAQCGYPVFLAERLNVGTKLYHRTCFRCARCNNQLSLANCYETETGEYCCETCPDEEDQPNSKVTKFDSLDNVKSISENNDLKAMEGIKQFDSSESLSQETDTKKITRLDQVRNRSLSDEEKSKGLQQFEEDEYSADFEHALDENMYQDDSLLSNARNNFISTHMLNEDPEQSQNNLISPQIFNEDPEQSQNNLIPPQIFKEDPEQSQNNLIPPQIFKEDPEQSQNNLISPQIFKEDPDQPQNNLIPPQLVNEDPEQSQNNMEANPEDLPPPLPESKPPDISSSSTSFTAEGASKNVIIIDLEETEAFKIVNKTNLNSEYQHNTACDAMLEETTNLREKNITKDTNRSSLVKSRMLIFELGNKNKDTGSITSLNTDKANIVAKYFNTNKKIEETTVPLKKTDISNSLTSVTIPNCNNTQEIDETVSSEEMLDDSSVSNEATNKTVKSDINISDSIGLNSSLLSENFPSNEENTRYLNNSIMQDLSMDQTAVSVTASIFEDSKEYPEDLNPFDDEERDFKQVIKPSMEDLSIITPPTNEEKRQSTNPFGSSDEDDEEMVVKQKPPRPPLPPVRTEGMKRVLEAPKVNLNPFWSDGEEPSEEDVSVKPVPMPRSKHLSTPEPKPRRSGLSNNASHYDSNSSLSSMNSSYSQTPGRKKKPAPMPPKGASLSPERSPSTSTYPSPKLTPRLRKTRKAPLPPMINDSPINNNKSDKSDVEESLVISPTINDIETEKINKDEKNRNRQSQTIASPVISDTDSLSLSQQGSSSDKSTHGKWKRKKGPAPARPVPQRRQIRPLPLTELRRELDIIETQQQGLEKQGVKLEQLIREKCEVPGTNDETALPPDVEDLVLELFELVNEKNELFRRQAELMFLRRQQRLEEEHADLEYQIRCLMERPERNKTDSDKAREEELINRLLEVVERRNEIVECLEMDRVREAEEDQSINFHLSQLASKKEEEQLNSNSPVKLSKKEKKKMKKEKKLKEKGKTIDVDKDIDETETNSVKDKKKKKWF